MEDALTRRGRLLEALEGWHAEALQELDRLTGGGPLRQLGGAALAIKRAEGRAAAYAEARSVVRTAGPEALTPALDAWRDAREEEASLRAEREGDSPAWRAYDEGALEAVRRVMAHPERVADADAAP